MLVVRVHVSIKGGMYRALHRCIAANSHTKTVRSAQEQQACAVLFEWSA